MNGLAEGKSAVNIRGLRRRLRRQGTKGALRNRKSDFPEPPNPTLQQNLCMLHKITILQQ